MVANIGLREDRGSPLHQQHQQIERFGGEMNGLTGAVEAPADAVELDVTEANPHKG
jgi:hypothetical protein